MCYHSGTMKASTRWFKYILLNIFISALVTGTILYFYDRYQRSQANPITLPAQVSTPGQASNLADLQLQIVSVIGAGVTETEVVVIQNMGQEAVLLTGWTLKNAAGDAFTFPTVNFFPGASLQVHTAAGANSPVDFYWGRTQPAWQHGAAASLFDTSGTLRATYFIP